MATRAPRRDSLPEERVYEDRGCRFSPRCLACTLPICVLDLPLGKTTIRTSSRQAKVVQLRAAGQSPAAIALALDVTERTIYRDLGRAA
jgi:hypothetical protein